MSKRTKIKIIVYAALLIVATVLLIWWFNFNNIRVRDYQRLGDMREVEAEMNRYFFKFNTYKIPECGEGSVINFCVGAGNKIVNVEKIIDPVNANNLRYVVNQMADDNFRIEFYLENGLAGLPSGQYALTKEGLGR